MKKTRALRMSCATSTAVMVTLPTRGSFTSRLMSSASTRCICASILRLRGRGGVAGLLRRHDARYCSVRATSTRVKHSIWSPTRTSW